MNDLINRQDAIDALEREKTYCTAFRDGHMPINVFENYNAGITDGIKALKNLPSAEKPFKLPEIYVVDGFDTIEDEDGNIGFGVYAHAENQIYVAGDVEDEIRARALLHEVCHWVQAMCGRPFDEDEANEFSDIVYDALPSAQPKTGYWIMTHDYFTGAYESIYYVKCSCCGEDSLEEGDYCPNCGAKMVEPQESEDKK